MKNYYDSKISFFICLIFLFLIGCANPLNKVTYYRYLNDGAHAERHGADGISEKAYSRALVKVYKGNLGPEREAEALFTDPILLAPLSRAMQLRTASGEN